MTRPFLTVLTAPILPLPKLAYRQLRAAVRPLVKPGVPLPATSPYPGHYALVRSVVAGLRSIGADFNFNPPTFGQLARVVYAPANEALRQAATLKRRGRIDFLVAGPTNALFADECDAVMLMPEIDLLILAADWAREFFQHEAPAIQAKIRICQAGVDSEYWKPSGAAAADRAVVYWKSGDEAFCEAVERLAGAHGLTVLRLRSGHGAWHHFDADSYRRALDGAAVGLFLSTFETQGLALVEAWAMDVPTLVWDPCGDAEWRGRVFRSRSSCPYLTSATGRTWRTLDELDALLRETLSDRGTFHPRDWVLAHMTDAICSAALYRIIENGVEGAERQ